MFDHPMLGAKSVAALLNISLRQLEKLISVGDAPRHIWVGKVRRWQPEEVDRWIQQKMLAAQADRRKREVASDEHQNPPFG